MPIEKERKFLVLNDLWKKDISSFNFITQGYLSLDPFRTVRARVLDDRGFLTIKGISSGDSRLEYEYEIPYEQAEDILKNICIKPLLVKKRYNVMEGVNIWSIDEFLGENEGLFIAEFEYSDINKEIYSIPEWLGKEVTGDIRYYNSYLCEKSYKSW